MANMTFIKLYRKIDEWEWRSDPKTFSLFIYFLTTANRFPSQFKGYTIETGQLPYGRHIVSHKLGMTEREIRTCMKRLKTTGEVTVKTTNKFSIITVCNYKTYQCDEKENDQQNDQQAVYETTMKRPHLNNNKNEKNEKKIIVTVPDYLTAIWNEFLEMRKAKGKKATLYAQSLLIKDLNEWYPNNQELQIKCVEESVKNSWQGFYKLKQVQQPKEPVFPI